MTANKRAVQSMNPFSGGWPKKLCVCWKTYLYWCKGPLLIYKSQKVYAINYVSIARILKVGQTWSTFRLPI